MSKKKLRNSEPIISGLEKDKDLLNCSLAELDAVSIKKEKNSKSLKDFDTIDGKSREEKDIERIKELEDLLGFKDMNPYGTLNKQVFADKLDFMTFSEMYELAGRVGVPASSSNNSKSLLKKSLLRSFDHYAQKHNVTVQGQARPILDKNSPNYDSAVRLFNE